MRGNGHFPSFPAYIGNPEEHPAKKREPCWQNQRVLRDWYCIENLEDGNCQGNHLQAKESQP